MASTKGCMFIDFETRSKRPIEDGAFAYAADPSTDILCVSYIIEDQEPIHATMDQKEILEDLFSYIRKGYIIVAHNMLFEIAVFKYVFVPKYDCPNPKLSQFRCTMQMAGRAGLPLALGQCAEALKITAKLESGKALIKLFSIPDANGRFVELDSRPREKVKLLEYCDVDTIVSRDIWRNLPEWKEEEIEDVLFDLKSNVYGVPVDVEASRIIYDRVLKSQAKFAARATAITGGIITKMTQAQRIKQWVQRNVSQDIKNCQADTVTEILDGKYGDVDPVSKEILEMRVHSGKSSTGKYVRYINSSIDGYVHGMIISFGCFEEGTGVWVKDRYGKFLIKRIEKVEKSDLVHDGENWVVHGGVVYQGEKELVYHENFYATPDHKVLFENRMTELQYLTESCHIQKNEVLNIHADCGNTMSARNSNKLRNQKKRYSDFEELYPLWKSDKLPGDKFRRLKSLILYYGYGTEEDFLKLDTRKHKAKSITKTGRTYDILDAGPKNRFTLFNGCIVSNCHTGRGISKLLNLYNLPKPSVKYETMDELVYDIQALGPKAINEKYGSFLKGASTAIRGMITAPKGKILTVSDYAAIEARIVFWLAGSKRGIQKYHDGIDLYIDVSTLRFSKSYASIIDSERWVGKQVILGAGFGLGPPGFVNSCARWGVDVELSVAENAITAYREEYPEVVDLWNDLENSAMKACKTGKVVFAAKGRIAFKTNRTKSGVIMLQMKLPSGRCMNYPDVKICIVQTPWGAKKKAVTYKKVKNNGWFRDSTYGGKLTENAVQAIARDIMYYGAKQAQSGGYQVLFSVYDEVVGLRNQEDSDIDKFSDLICRKPKWAEGLPLEAEGKMMKHYQKI